jgi:hypothetical protein
MGQGLSTRSTWTQGCPFPWLSSWLSGGASEQGVVPTEATDRVISFEAGSPSPGGGSAPDLRVDGWRKDLGARTPALMLLSTFVLGTVAGLVVNAL